MKLPAIQWYPGDWLKDPGVRSLTYEERGIWFEILMHMFNSSERGKLTLNGRAMPMEALARLLGLTDEKTSKVLDKLLSYGVASRDEETGVYFNRRMVRDEIDRQARKEDGTRGGNPALGVNYNRPGFLYAMQRASDGWVKIGISENPSKRLYKVRYSQRMAVELLGTKFVQDMGLAESKMHAKYAGKGKGEWFALNDDEIGELLSTLKGQPKGKETPSSSSSISSSISKENPLPPFQQSQPPAAVELTPDDVGYWVDLIVEMYPSPADARSVYRWVDDNDNRLSASGRDRFLNYMTEVQIGLEEWVAYWETQGNQFVPDVMKWLHGTGWKKHPPKPKPIPEGPILDGPLYDGPLYKAGEKV